MKTCPDCETIMLTTTPNEYWCPNGKCLTKVSIPIPPQSQTPIPRTDEIEIKHELSDGKYTYLFYKNGGQECLRYGNKWRDLTGDNLTYCLAYELTEAKERVSTLERKLAAVRPHALKAKIKSCEEALTAKDLALKQLQCVARELALSCKHIGYTSVQQGHIIYQAEQTLNAYNSLPPEVAGAAQCSATPKIYVFVRAEGFYILEFRDDAEAIRNAECNPGTQNVSTIGGRPVWPTMY